MEKVISNELFKYGFVPLLIVLERMERLQEYEICEIIIDVIKKHNEEYDLDIPTVLDGEAIAQMKIAFMTKFNLSGDITYSNREYYADEVFKAIEKQRIKENSEIENNDIPYANAGNVNRGNIEQKKEETPQIKEIEQTEQIAEQKVIMTGVIPQCPYCKVPTERTGGFNSMTCVYYPPNYDKDGNNTNPDRNIRTSVWNCKGCGKDYTTVGNNANGFFYK